jgi:hypothetical protein
MTKHGFTLPAALAYWKPPMSKSRKMFEGIDRVLGYIEGRGFWYTTTNWHRAGVDIRTLGYLAGHSRIEHTERYLGAITPAQIDAVPDAFARTYSRRAATA